MLLKKRRTDYRVKIQVSGVRMKLKLHSHAKAAGWRIYGGVQVEYRLEMCIRDRPEGGNSFRQLR